MSFIRCLGYMSPCGTLGPGTRVLCSTCASWLMEQSRGAWQLKATSGARLGSSLFYCSVVLIHPGYTCRHLERSKRLCNIKLNTGRNMLNWEINQSRCLSAALDPVTMKKQECDLCFGCINNFSWIPFAHEHLKQLTGSLPACFWSSTVCRVVAPTCWTAPCQPTHVLPCLRVFPCLWLEPEGNIWLHWQVAAAAAGKQSFVSCSMYQLSAFHSQNTDFCFIRL